MYTVKATVDIDNKLDINKEATFNLVNLHSKKIIHTPESAFSPSVHGGVNNNDPKDGAQLSSLSSDEIVEGDFMNNHSNKKSSASERFEQVFGTGTAHQKRPSFFTPRRTGINIDLVGLFSKGHDHFTK